MELLEITNRRASTRFREPGGSALCRTDAGTQRYEIQNASLTGVALSGPQLHPGTQVSLQLWWPMIGSAKAKGIVCRDDRSSQRIGVKYTEDEGIGALLSHLFSIDRMRRTEAAPLFCGESNALALAMRQLDEAGFVHWHARTPLEALRYLQDPWKPLTSTVFAPASRWLEFASFVSTEHSRLRRILLADSANAEHTASDEPDRFDEYLCGPWHPLGLYSALGLQLSDSPCVCCGDRIPARATAFCAPCKARSSQLCELDDLGGGD